jgi:hypothetical protein
LEFSVATGRARAAVEALRGSLRQAGWKEEVAGPEGPAGAVSLSKQGGSLTIPFTETGVRPAEVEITGIGVEMRAARAEAP